MSFTVYILYSEKYNKVYTGFTSNLIKRFHSHNELGTKGYTKNFRPWIIAYTEHFAIKQQAMIREKQLKTANGRIWIWNKINEQYKKDGFFSI